MPFKVGAKSLPLADCVCSSQLPVPAAAPCGVNEYRPHVGAAPDALLRAEQATAVRIYVCLCVCACACACACGCVCVYKEQAERPSGASERASETSMGSDRSAHETSGTIEQSRLMQRRHSASPCHCGTAAVRK